MEIETRIPGPELAGHVRSLWLVRGTAPYPAERIFPMPVVHLIVNLSGPYRATVPGEATTTLGAVFCSGPRAHFVLSENPGQLFNIGAVLEPHALREFGIDPAEVAGRIATVDERMPTLAALAAQVATRERGSDDAPTSDQPLLDEFEEALGVLLDERAGDPTVRRALALIEADPEQAIAGVAERCGLSHQGLSAAVKRATGVTPKLFADLVRFDRLIEAFTVGGDASWSALAAESGYYDQSHFIRRFKSFTGFTPSEYRRIAREAGPEAARFVPWQPAL